MLRCLVMRSPGDSTLERQPWANGSVRGFRGMPDLHHTNRCWYDVEREKQNLTGVKRPNTKPAQRWAMVEVGDSL